MKVLVFSQEFANPTLTFIYNEMTGVANRVSLRVLTCKRLNEQLFPFDDVVEIPFEQQPFLAKLKYKLRSNNLYPGFISGAFKRKAAETIRQYNPDIIHTHFGFESLLLLLNVKVKDQPIFISFHGYDASHKLNSRWYRYTIKRLLNKDNVHAIFVSHYMKNCVEAKIGKVKRANILYYGTDIAFFKREVYTNQEDAYTFLQVSSFAEKKGHVYTIAAYKKFREANPSLNTKLILAGQGPLLAECQQLVQKLDLNDSVVFPGIVTRVEAKALMEKANCFLHHSVTSSIGDTEGIPNAIMEAMAMELPIISTIHAGIPELVENDKHGYLVPEKEIEAYALAMQKMISWKLKPENRKKIQQLFEKEQHAEQLIGFYKAALEK